MRRSLNGCVVFLLVGPAGCTAGDGGCRAPSVNEAVYPFSGVATLAGGGATYHVCLYQADARTVRGSVSGQEVVGQVTEGGSLFLPLPTTDGTSVIELRLTAAGLVVASEPVRGAPEPLRVRQWVRPGSATASPDD